MAEKEMIQKEFIAGKTVKFKLSDFDDIFAIEECNIYYKKLEFDKWAVYGLCSKVNVTGEEYEEYAFCLSLTPKITNAFLYDAPNLKEIPIDYSNFDNYFNSNEDGFYFFPVDSYSVTPYGNKLSIYAAGYVEGGFDIEDCEVGMRRIPLSEYNKINDSYPFGECFG